MCDHIAAILCFPTAGLDGAAHMHPPTSMQQCKKKHLHFFLVNSELPSIDFTSVLYANYQKQTETSPLERVFLSLTMGRKKACLHVQKNVANVLCCEDIKKSKISPS